MATTDEMRFYEDIFTLLGEVPTERIVAKIESAGRHLDRARLVAAFRAARERFAPDTAGRAAALDAVIRALEPTDR